MDASGFGNKDMLDAAKLLRRDFQSSSCDKKSKGKNSMNMSQTPRLVERMGRPLQGLVYPRPNGPPPPSQRRYTGFDINSSTPVNGSSLLGQGALDFLYRRDEKVEPNKSSNLEQREPREPEASIPKPTPAPQAVQAPLNASFVQAGVASHNPYIEPPKPEQDRVPSEASAPSNPGKRENILDVFKALMAQYPQALDKEREGIVAIKSATDGKPTCDEPRSVIEENKKTSTAFSKTTESIEPMLAELEAIEQGLHNPNHEEESNESNSKGTVPTNTENTPIPCQNSIESLPAPEEVPGGKPTSSPRLLQLRPQAVNLIPEEQSQIMNIEPEPLKLRPNVAPFVPQLKDTNDAITTEVAMQQQPDILDHNSSTKFQDDIPHNNISAQWMTGPSTVLLALAPSQGCMLTLNVVPLADGYCFLDQNDTTMTGQAPGNPPPNTFQGNATRQNGYIAASGTAKGATEGIASKSVGGTKTARKPTKGLKSSMWASE